MGWTKREFIVAALEELGLSDYVFDIQPDEFESLLRRLDSMMAAWDATGLTLGYPTNSNQDNSSLSQVTEVPAAANEAVFYNLAIRIASTYGKVVSKETKTAARRGKNAARTFNNQLKPREKQVPSTMPIGAGNRRSGTYGRNFFPTPEDPIENGRHSFLED
jgi:hypothetical protein